MQPNAQEALRRYRQRNGRDFLTQKPIEKNAAGLTPEQERIVLEAVESRDKAAAAASTPAYNGKDFMELAEEYRDKKGCTLVDAMMYISKKHPEARQAYIKKHNPHAF